MGDNSEIDQKTALLTEKSLEYQKALDVSDTPRPQSTLIAGRVKAAIVLSDTKQDKIAEQLFPGEDKNYARKKMSDITGARKILEQSHANTIADLTGVSTNWLMGMNVLPIIRSRAVEETTITDISPQDKAIALSVLAQSFERELNAKIPEQPDSVPSAARLKAVIQLSSLTQEEARERVDLTTPMYSKLITARKKLTNDLADKLAELTGTDAGWLLGENVSPIQNTMPFGSAPTIQRLMPQTPSKLELEITTELEPGTGDLALAVHGGKVVMPMAAEMEL